MPLTKPGLSDGQWLAVTCSPEATTVEFCEEREEAVDAARINLMPAVSTYVGHIELQGQHRTRGSSKHLAVHVEVTPAIRAALRVRFPAARSRGQLQAALSTLMAAALAALGEPEADDEEITAVMRGRERVLPAQIDEAS